MSVAELLTQRQQQQLDLLHSLNGRIERVKSTLIPKEKKEKKNDNEPRKEGQNVQRGRPGKKQALIA